MRIVVTIVFVLIALILQLALREVGYYISLASISLAYLCVLLLTRNVEEVLWLALGAGVVLDVLSGSPDGVMAISMPAGVKFAHYIGNIFFTERLHSFLLPSYALFATAGSVITGLLVLGIMSLVGWVYPPDGQHYLAWLLPITVLLNLASLVPAYGLHKVEAMIQKRYIPKHESI